MLKKNLNMLVWLKLYKNQSSLTNTLKYLGMCEPQTPDIPHTA